MCGESKEGKKDGEAEGRTVLLTEAANEMEAELLRTLLEAEGIPCILSGTVPKSVFPLTVDGLAGVKVLVLERDLERSRRVIEEAGE